jgi:hypothetical protein
MGGQVIGTEVSFDLDQAAPQALAVDFADHHLSQQVARHRDGVAIEELGA